MSGGSGPFEPQWRTDVIEGDVMETPETPPDGSTTDVDLEEIRVKYRLERDRRLVQGRTDIRELDADAHFSGFRKDPFHPDTEREPVVDEVDVVIVGGGIAGLLAGANLRQAGVQRIRIVDEAGGIGGTWYWNQYPGVMCD